MKSWMERGRWLCTQLRWNAGRPDPRVLHGGFAALLAAILVLRALGGAEVEPLSWPVAGVGIAVLLTVVLTIPGAIERRWLILAVAVLSIATLGMLAAGSDLGGASPLLVLPALYLGLELGLGGAGLAVAATLAFISLPGLIAHGVGPATLERLVVLPVVAGVGAVAISAGLTAARAAQARAEEREAELLAAMKVIERNRRSAEAIFEAVDIGLALLGADGQPLLINQRLAEFSEMAYPGGDLADPWVFDEDGTSRLPVDVVPTSRARRGEEFDDVRVWVGRDEASRRAMSISARRVEDEDGNLLGAAVSYTDVTELMRALQVKDQFMALVSHELRTPLTSIVGYVAVMRDRPDLDDLLHKHLNAVARNADRLERLVGDLLSEGSTPRPEPVVGHTHTDLASIIHDCVTAARAHAEKAGVALTVDVPAALRFRGDPGRLGRAVTNLVSNAIKYTGPGGQAGVHAAVETDHVVIRIHDTGMGISPEDHAHVFTRFYRTREATLAAIQGVGLGLSIAKAIIEGHGGRIEVDSELGQGSEFRVVLPLPSSARLAS
ncbi:sensor histidine kinase [Nocardioides mangrovi]|uniref:histidine kinase n=1 Tax=Nocardioides mangrovi TaxID=2874580 RepID=A0ABS7UJ29_9ACTN|nr:ATP-binding protein [Nocardioides mangrovi]MBZ5741024.1 PAS domain-containing sensor histidine kinase [Nocardioides mangrovi]